MFSSPDDVRSIDYRRDLGDPGQYPFTRGRLPRQNGAVAWIHRELSGEGSPARSNEQLRYLIAHGAGGLDVIGDAPTVALLDADHPLARLSVGTQGVSLCRAGDYAELYDGIPIEEVTLSHSLPPAFAIAGLYLVAQQRGVDPGVLRGSVINAPFFMEDYGYATLLTFEARMRLALDPIEFATFHMPKFHPFVEDTYFISDGGVGPVEEMALGFVEIREVVRRLLDRGLPIDSFGPRIAILVNCRMDLFEEIAKIRATRRIFARMMREEWGAEDPRSWQVNISVHSSGASLTSQQPVNNVVRGALQALAMAMAGVQAMEVSAFDEAYRTPSAAAHMVGLRTQQIVALETDVLAAADPLGGSYHVERLTNELEEAILHRIATIEGLGSPSVLFEQGYFRGVFSTAMVGRSGAIADSSIPVVGLNCFTIPEEEDTMLREHTDAKIEPYTDHAASVTRWKEDRDQVQVTEWLERLTEQAAKPDVNLMPALIEAFEAGVTMGEITDAVQRAYGSSRSVYDVAGEW